MKRSGRSEVPGKESLKAGAWIEWSWYRESSEEISCLMKTVLECEELQTTRRQPFYDGCLLGVLVLYVYVKVGWRKRRKEEPGNNGGDFRP